MTDNTIQTRTLPLLALRGLHVFPEMLLTFDVERTASIGALSMAAKSGQLIFLAAQKSLTADMPQEEDIYQVGTVCRIRQQLRQPRGNVCRVMVEGLYRARFLTVNADPKGYTAEIIAVPDKDERVSAARREALLRNCMSLFEEYIQFNQDMVNEQLLNLLANPNAAYVSNYISQTVHFNLEDKQKLLEEMYPNRRLAMLCKLLNAELDVLNIEKELNDAAQEAMNRNQREYYLREEMKAIQAELGEDDDIENYRAKIEALPVSDEIKERLNKELGRLAKQPFGSSEAAVIRSYLDVCLEIPWGKTTHETVNIAKARKILDEDHYGLEKVKERICEYLAVKQLSPEIKGGLLCLVGPPGTGKTSIAQSIARATNRKLVTAIEFATETLAGIPSILYALVGMLVFCQLMKLGTTLLAGSLTLVIMTLPTIIRTTQESLKTVPQGYREGALGLGAGKWHMIRTIVLPDSIDGIVTGCILSIGRIVGESAVLMFTAGMSTGLQDFFSKGGLTHSSGATLTVALYGYAKENARFDLAFSVALVLLVITLVINLAAKLAGKRLKK